jgi:hypothetical protein
MHLPKVFLSLNLDNPLREVIIDILVLFWAGDTRANFDWLCEHAKETCKEYTFRFGKTHFCEKGIYTLSSLSYLIPDGPLQEFAVAISDHMNCRKLPDFNIMSVSDKYRNYYKMDKPFAKWEKGRTKPEWF